jgi:hypothetical protein
MFVRDGFSSRLAAGSSPVPPLRLMSVQASGIHLRDPSGLIVIVANDN